MKHVILTCVACAMILISILYTENVYYRALNIAGASLVVIGFAGEYVYLKHKIKQLEKETKNGASLR